MLHCVGIEGRAASVCRGHRTPRSSEPVWLSEHGTARGLTRVSQPDPRPESCVTTSTMIVVPTYWTWHDDRSVRLEDAIFDHPTPVDREGTLSRLLASLCQVPEVGGAKSGALVSVFVLIASVHADLDHIAQQRVSEIIAPFHDRFPVARFAAADLTVLHSRMRELGLDELQPTFSLRSYPGVRNCQLAVAHMLDAQVIIALDDDQVVAPDYLRRATTFIGGDWHGHRISGVCGRYADHHGEWRLPENELTGNIFLDKAAIMNEAVHRLMAQDQALVESSLAYGGNMVFHRELFTRVGFDPWITRGEDIDYLINARLQGLRFWFDRQLLITHMPPDEYQSAFYAKLCQDVIRFIYEREKLRQAGVDAADFDPYPGRFLRDDIEEHALAALSQAAMPAAVAKLGPPDRIVARAQHHAREALPRYLAHARTWPCLMDALAGDAFLRDHWQAKFTRHRK